MLYYIQRSNLQWIIQLALLPLVLGGMLNPTDTITWGGDNTRTGYQSTHKMDPDVVGSPSFGQIFKTLLPGFYQSTLEQIFSQPLVYTLDDGIQYVFIATTQNNIYKLNAETGAIVASRNLHVPFLTADLDGCVDINPLVGVTATGVIDPTTDTWYLTAKTYVDQTDQVKGRENGRYFFHAIDVNTLKEKPEFPVDLEGTLSRNGNGNRMFQGGSAHQRPALLHQGEYVYAGFASHCVQYNFTGWIMGWDKTTGANVEAYAMEGGPEPNSVKGGGVWMSGGGIASDGEGSMYFATGNGYASQLNGISVPGHQPPTSLEEAAVHATLNDDGTITVVDFFMPFEKVQLDGADKDLGTSPLELLPTDVFTCPTVKRMGVVTGKSGKTYFLNIDDLGGYQMGANHLDAVPQVTQNENSVYAGAGVYPLEGGYIYINVIQYQTHVFKFSCDANGKPVFTHVADSPDKNAYILGVGHGTVTSLDGQEGTGLLWTSDVQGYALRIYNAVPSNGFLTMINAFNVVGITKFTRPVFGDARVYLGTTQGALYGFGSPVNLPLNCSSPYDFGTVVVGNSSKPMAVQCQANTATQVTAVALNGMSNFNISGIPQLPFHLAAGANFTFYAVFSPSTPGSISSDVILNTTATGYTPNTPISLKGIGESLSPVLSVSPNTVSFAGVITGEEIGGIDSSAIFLNEGDGSLSITSIDYSIVSEGGATVKPNVTSSGVQVGPFTFPNLPTSIPGKSQVTVDVNFNPSTSGNFAVYMTIHSSGGDQLFDVFGTSGAYPVALVEFQAADGSGNWIPYSNTTAFTFGSVTEQGTQKLNMRLTNKGDSDSGRLSVTVSKPPFGVPGIIGAVNGVDLAEGTTLGAGESATAALYCSVPKSQVNVDAYNGTAQWTMNTGDPTMGKIFIQFICQAVSEQVGPVAANGSALYRYDFCAVENNPGRQLSQMLYSSSNNTNDMCITACGEAGYKYCGTQYRVECWAGNSVPIESTLIRDCNFACSGNDNQTCGGNGLYANGSYISLFNNPAIVQGAPNPIGGNTGNTPSILEAPATIGGFSYVGCYTEATAGRALAGSRVDNDTGMTLEFCASQMQAYMYFGVEYGEECYGSNQLTQGSIAASASDCSMACPGNSTEPCGAGNRLQLYQTNSTISSPSASSTSTSMGSTPTSSSKTPATIGKFFYVGCYTEATTGRALFSSNVDNDTAMTLEWCANQMEGYAYFGVEYGQECYGGDLLAQGSVPAPATDCSFPCPGNANELCGAGNRLQLYHVNSTISSSTTTSTTTIATSVSVTSTIASSAAILPTASVSTIPMVSGPYSFIGCYSELGNGRALSGASNYSSKSVDNCAAFCAANGGTRYFGVEYYGQCFCGDVLDSQSQPTTGCNYPCDLNSTQVCGGSAVLDLYEMTVDLPTSTSTSLATPTPTGPTTLQSLAGWSYFGCYTEGTNQRALSGLQNPESGTNNTVELCAAACASYTYFGVEYAGECYCGNSFSAGSVLAPGGNDVTQNGCSMTCLGNPMEYCGGPNRLDVYKSKPVVSGTSSTTFTSSTASTKPASSSTTSTTATTGTTTASNSTPSTPGTTTTSTSASVTPSSTITSTSASLPSITSTTTTSSSTPTPTGPVTVQSLSGWSFLGCYTEGSQGRALSGLENPIPANNVSIESCAAACSTYTYFGVEYSSECYCGNTINTGSVLAPGGSDITQNGCSMTCSGNPYEYCGGPNRLDLYKASSTITTASSTLSSSTLSTGKASSTSAVTPSSVSTSSLTSSQSTTTSQASSASISSTSSVSSTSSKSISTTSSSTTTTIMTSASTLSVSTVTTITVSSSQTPSSTTSTSIAGPTVAQLSDWTYLGCYTEGTSARALASSAVVASNMTVEYCASLAIHNYEFFGVEYADECYMGNSFSAGSAQASPTDCSKTCAGNKTELCGGSSRLNVYQATAAIAPVLPVVVPGNVNFTYYNCIVEPSSGRALSTQLAATNTMTVETCLSLAYNYRWAGLEYGRECWASNSLNPAATNASSASQCGKVCAGNATEFCGDSLRLSAYYNGP